MRLEKIDTHSHLGTDGFHPHPGDIAEYCTKASQKTIVRSYLFPVPCPRYPKDGGYFTPSFREVYGMHARYYSEFEKNGRRMKQEVGKNPFAEYNLMIKRQIRDMNDSGCFPRLRLEFIPLVDPLRDTLDHIEDTCSQKPPAIKIHGTSWGIDPKAISPPFFEIIRQYHVPLILHTDYHIHPRNALDIIQRANDPLVWIELCRKHEIRAILAHGARLCKQSLDIVNASDSFLVGMSPKLNLPGFRVKRVEGNYLHLLCEMLDPRKLVFDMDYPWNVDDGHSSLAWDMDEELHDVLSAGELRKVYFMNAADFFGLST